MRVLQRKRWLPLVHDPVGMGHRGEAGKPPYSWVIVGLRTATQLEMRDLNHREGKGILDLVPTREVTGSPGSMAKALFAWDSSNSEN